MGKFTDKKTVKRYVLLGIACLVILGSVYYMESQETVFQEDGSIARNPAGQGNREVTLILNGEGIPENYDYTVEVKEAILTEQEAFGLLKQAIEEIDRSFWAEGDSADHVTRDVNVKESYAEGRVSAEWYFDDYHYVTAEGVITTRDENGNDLLDESGFLCHAKVKLTCDGYEEDYEFPFLICPMSKTVTEQLLMDISKAIAANLSSSGSSSLFLPQEVSGVRLSWSDKPSYLTLKVFFWLTAILILLRIAEEEDRQNKRKKRREEITREYPEIVSKLSILMGAGMSLKQSWSLIAHRYEHDRGRGVITEKPAYEEMIVTMREIKDGGSERNAYQRFGERCQTQNFYHLSRILVRNLQKGNRDLCELLQKEAEDAFEERKLWARKKGEEAGTKMLIPLMLMMMIVIAIVIVPAFMGMNL